LGDALLAAKAARVIAGQEAVWEAERIVEQAAEEVEQAAWEAKERDEQAGWDQWLAEWDAEEAEGVDTVPLNTDEDEYALLEVPAHLMKLNRHFHGRSHGGLFRVMRGVSLRMGEMIGRGKTDEAWLVADSGYFTVTNKRLVFRGDEENIEFSMRSIVRVSELSVSELAIQAKRRKTARFSFPGFTHVVAARVAEASGRRLG
jgi:hypothetical protein